MSGGIKIGAIAIFISFFVPFVRASEVDDVVVLKESTLHDFVSSNDVVLVKFYATWCMHCQALAPEYAKAAKMLKDEGSNIILAKVNAEDAKGLLQKFNIEGYPTLKLFKKGAVIDYSGPRLAEGIVSWCKGMLSPAVVVINDPAEEFFGKDESISFLSTGFSEDDELYREFERQADIHRGMAKFYATKSGAREFEVHHPDYETTKFSGTTVDDLAQFIRDESLPLLGEIDQTNYMRYISSGKDISWFCGTELDYKKYRAPFSLAAKEMRSSVLFVWLDSDKFTSVRDAFVIERIPSVAHQSSSGRYILSEADGYDFSSHESILKFYKDVESGLIPKSVRSEAEPHEDTGPVKVVVGKSLESLFSQKTKSILLMIYAPHCEHCKKFMPIFESFAESVDSEFPLIIAKLNGDANESPLDYVKWDAFPTLLLYKAGTTEPIPFEDKRTSESLISFVEEHLGSLSLRTEL